MPGREIVQAIAEFQPHATVGWHTHPGEEGGYLLEGEFLFEVIMRRYETRSTVMTSNRPLEDWGKLIGDVPLATAILDCFLHHAEVVTITGKSYRLRNQSTATTAAKGKKVNEPETAACVE